jgi:hypothetical protein
LRWITNGPQGEKRGSLSKYKYSPSDMKPAEGNLQTLELLDDEKTWCQDILWCNIDKN